jgi:hypothetical protein
MLTCKWPRKVMLVAHHLASLTLPKYRSKFSRHDFTLPQLFACLVVKEQQRKAYRDIEALLRDAPHWCQQIGMKKVPDHNTLCRAFHALNLSRRAGRLLERLTQWFAVAKQLGTTAALDSSLYDPRYRSRHYEQRCRHYRSMSQAQKSSVNTRRSRTARLCPKLAIGVCTRSHLILCARARTGFGSDCPDFAPLLLDACKHHPRLRTVLADAGFDSEANHRIARLDMGVRSIIKAGVRPKAKHGPSGYYRRIMSRRLKGSQRGKPYGQRAQAETVNSMLKRNMGDALRSRSPQARRNEQLLRALAHNIALLCDEVEG